MRMLAASSAVLVLGLAGCSPAASEAPPAQTAPAPVAPEHPASAARIPPDAAPPPAEPVPAPAAAPAPEPRVYYSYVDDSGSIRMVDRLEAVPAALREKARRIELGDGATGSAQAAAEPAAGARAPSPFVRAAERASASERRAPAVTIFTAKWCGWCQKALAHLDQRGVDYINRDIDDDPSARGDLRRLAGSTSIPLLDIGGQLVRGFDAKRIDTLLEGR